MTETGAGGGPDISISIVIPIYNEAPFLVDAVRAIIGEMREKVDRRFELILAENGSRDSTITVAESLKGNFRASSACSAFPCRIMAAR